MTSPLIETSGGWELPVRGWTVTRCFVDPAAFGLLLDGGTGDILRLYLEREFTLKRSSSADATSFNSNRAPTEYAQLLHLIDGAVSGVEISNGGILRVQFESGDQIEAPPDPTYEAWELEGLGRLMVVCTPGGELAIFNG
jgi:hypothetical protein